MVWNTNSQVRLLAGSLMLFLGVGCHSQSATAPGQPVATAEKFSLDELQTYLTDPHLLNRLGVKKLKVVQSHGDWVTVGTDRSDAPLGDVYYTIQDGWHLKAENERMEHVPGKGWRIWEQSESPYSDAYRGLTPLSDADAEKRAINLCRQRQSLMEGKVLHTKAAPAAPDYTEVLVQGTIDGQQVERTVWIHRFNAKGDKIKNALLEEDDISPPVADVSRSA